MKCQHCQQIFTCNVGAFKTHVRFCGRDDAALLWERVDKNGSGGCWLWLGPQTTKGYARLCLNRTYVKGHRYVYELMVRKLQPGEWCLHKCDVRHCVNPAHLFIGDNDANMADKLAKGRIWSKLKPDEVRTIKSLLGKKTGVELAGMFNVSQSAISEIKKGKKWKHVQ